MSRLSILLSVPTDLEAPEVFILSGMMTDDQFSGKMLAVSRMEAKMMPTGSRLRITVGGRTSTSFGEQRA
jgi:hypothetical protein